MTQSCMQAGLEYRRNCRYCQDYGQYCLEYHPLIEEVQNIDFCICVGKAITHYSCQISPYQGGSVIR